MRHYWKHYFLVDFNKRNISKTTFLELSGGFYHSSGLLKEVEPFRKLIASSDLIKGILLCSWPLRAPDECITGTFHHLQETEEGPCPTAKELSRLLCLLFSCRIWGHYLGQGLQKSLPFRLSWALSWPIFKSPTNQRAKATKKAQPSPLNPTFQQ